MSREIKVIFDNEHQFSVTTKKIGYLKELGYKSVKPIKKPLLSKKNIQKRYEFAEKYILFSDEDWENVTFSDETKINLFRNDSPAKVWCKPTEKLKSKNILKSVKYNGGSLMWWGCFK